MLSQEERNALKNLLKGTPLDKGKDWLKRVHIESTEGSGWPHLTAQEMPTVWGGTADGIRALAALGTSPYDPILAKSIRWLLSQQRDDGGFSSREITYSAAECTAWLLITFREMAIAPTSSEQLTKALHFLESCVRESGEVATSNRSDEEARTYPSMLALWAMHGYSDKSPSIARYLKDSRDPITGGWSLRAKGIPNARSTAQVLRALLISGNLLREDILTAQAIRYLLTKQQKEGNWDNFTETWYSLNQPHLPLRCDEFSTAWCLLALLEAGLSPVSEPVAKAISCLIYSQADDGYWLYDPLDESKHIWCTTDTLVSLSAARRSLLDSITGDGGMELWADENAHREYIVVIRRLTARNVIRAARLNFTNIVVVALIIYIFRSEINSLIAVAGNFLRIEGNQLFVNVLGAAIYSLLFFTGTWILRKGKSIAIENI